MKITLLLVTFLIVVEATQEYTDDEIEVEE